MVHGSGQAVSISDVAFFVPCRFDSRDRLENLTAVLGHYRTVFDGMDINVVEDAATPEAEPLARATGAQHHFFRNSGGFHKTRLLNRAFFTLSDKPFVAVLDTDVLLHPRAIEAALDLLARGASVVQPFDGRFFEVQGDLRRSLLDAPQDAIGLLERLRGSANSGEATTDLRLMNTDCAGACVIFRRSALEAAGGYCELFTRWGFEDDEILTRARRFGFSLERVADWPLLHLAHPRVLANWSWYWMGGANRWLYRRMSGRSLEDIEKMKRKGVLGPLPAARPADLPGA